MVVIRFVIAAVLIAALGYFIMYNRRLTGAFISYREKFAKVLFGSIGKKVKKTNIKVQRKATLNRDSTFYKVYHYYDDILVSLDMKKDGVSVTGLLAFMLFTSLAVAVITLIFMNNYNIFVILGVVCAVFYLETTLFKLSAVTMYEKREAEIMDAVDLLVSDIKSGVYNAIVRYKDSFHPDIKPYFLEFIDDVQNKGYGFRQAMLLLNERLGMTFSEFAHKAILYEEKADKNMDDIFSSIIEVNRQRRSLRYVNNIEFANLRTQFLVSFAAIVGYALFAMFMDDWIRGFMFSAVGTVFIIVDILIVTIVLNYMAVIKAQSL